MDEIRVTDVGRKIRLIRLALGLNLEALARGSEISALHLSHVEKGKREAGDKALARIARQLGTDLEALMNWDLVFHLEETT